MNVVVHYPKDTHSQDTLKEQVAILHGEYIYSYLSKQDISIEKKVEIVKGIRSAIN